MSRVSTGASCSTTALAMSSTAAISSSDIGFGCEKSKRSRSGATSEPFCATCVPSVSRSAAWRRCVAEWLARIALRRRAVDLEPHRLPGHEAADLDLAEMHEEAVGLLLRVGDAKARAVLRLDHAGVADLPARLAVEGRLVDDDRALLALAELIRFRAVLDEREHRRLGAVRVVAQELGRAVAVAERQPHVFRRRVAGPDPARPRLGALPLHRVGEARRDRRRCRAPSARPASDRAESRRCRRA